MSYRASFHTEANDPNSTSPESALVGSATLELDVVRADDRGVRFAGRMSHFQVALDTAQAIELQTGKDLRADFEVDLGVDGRVTSVAFPPGASVSMTGLLRSIVGLLQFVRPANVKGAGAFWEVEETDAVGAYTALYESLGDNRYKKSAARYREIALAELLALGQDGAKAEASFEATLELDSENWPSTVDSKQRLNLMLAADSVTTLTSYLRLELQSTTRHHALASASGSWGRNPITDAPTHHRTAMPMAAKRQILGGADFEQLNTAMRQAIAASDEDARHDVASRMSALFDLVPGSAQGAAETLRGDVDAKVVQTTLGAMAAADGLEALEALTGVATDAQNTRATRDHAITHLGLHEAPTEAAIDTLTDLANDESQPELRQEATLALGGAARHAADDPTTEPRAQKAVDDLTRQLEIADGPQAKQLLLEALGNAGDSRSLDAIRPYLSDENVHVRASAVSSLRFLQGEDVDSLIAHAWLNDPEHVVRMAAVEAADYRVLTEALATVAFDSLKSDTVEAVRAMVIDLLDDDLATAPARARDALAWASQNDPSEEIRATAAESLSKG